VEQKQEQMVVLAEGPNWRQVVAEVKALTLPKKEEEAVQKTPPA
jgi:hypothetical protein